MTRGNSSGFPLSYGAYSNKDFPTLLPSPTPALALLSLLLSLTAVSSLQCDKTEVTWKDLQDRVDLEGGVCVAAVL